MALTATFVKNAKYTGAPAGDKHRDGGGMYLLVNASGKYWRMDYRFADKRKTLALGVYPAVSLEKARKRREAARGHPSVSATSCWFFFGGFVKKVVPTFFFCQNIAFIV